VAVASARPYASLHLAPDRQPHQHPTTLFFTGWMPFLPPNQQRQSTEGTDVTVVFRINVLPTLMGFLGMNFVSAKQSPEESQEEEMEMFKKLYIEWKGEDQSIDPQYKVIPRFYFKVHIFDYVKTHILMLYFKVSFVICMLS